MSNSQADTLAEQILVNIGFIDADLMCAMRPDIRALAALAKQQASPDAQAVAALTDEWIDNRACEYVYLRSGYEAEQYSELRLFARAVEAEVRAAIPQVHEQAALPDLRGANVGVVIERDGMSGRFVCNLTDGYTPFVGDVIYAPLPASAQADIDASIAQGTTPAAGVGEQATGGEKEWRALKPGEPDITHAQWQALTPHGRMQYRPFDAALKPAQAEPMSDERIDRVTRRRFGRLSGGIELAYRLYARDVLAEAGIKEKT